MVLLCNRRQWPNEAQRHIVPTPEIDVSIIVQRDGNHLGVGLRHIVRHGTPRATQRLERPGLFQQFRRALYIGCDDHVIAPAGFDESQVNIQPAGECAHRWCRSDHSNAGWSGWHCRVDRTRSWLDYFRGFHSTHYGATVGTFRLFKLHQRIAGFDDVTRLPVTLRQHTTLR